MSEDRTRRRERLKRNRSHLAHSLENPIFRQRKKESKRKNTIEDEDERRYRRYKDYNEIGLNEEE